MTIKYVEYKDRNESGQVEIVKGNFEVMEETENFIKIKTKKNIIKIPYHNIEKIKEKIERGFN
jgi:hypothetical protein